MAKQDIINLVSDTLKGKLPTSYSKSDITEALRQEFITLNGGSTVINKKSLRRNPELYEILETIIPIIINEGLQDDPMFTEFVDERNLQLGDSMDFVAHRDANLIVTTVAEGVLSPRRQRLESGAGINLKPTLKVIKIYEDINRLTSGRVDFDGFVAAIGKSFRGKIYEDMYTAIDGISASTDGMSTTYYKTATYNEEDLMKLIDHVEAASGSTAKIIAPRSVLRKLTTAVVADEAKSDMYGVGYYGKFNGTPIIALRQRHKPGTDDFMIDDSKLYVVASDDKFIKFVNDGEGSLDVDTDATANQDMTQEYLYGQRTAVGILLASRIGVYEITNQ